MGILYMSINSLPDNPIVLAEAATALLPFAPSFTPLYTKLIAYSGGQNSVYSTTGTPTGFVNVNLTGLTPGKQLLVFFSVGYFVSGGTNFNVICNITGISAGGTTQTLTDQATAASQRFTFSQMFSILSSTLQGSSQTLSFSIGVVNAVNWQTDANGCHSVAIYEIQ